MGMLPIDRMWQKIDTSCDDSDTAFFLELMYCAEMITKLVTVGMIASIEDDRERHRYRQEYRIVRADGVGEWSAVLDDVLTGPASQHLTEQAWNEQKELTLKNNKETWQYQAVNLLHSCVSLVNPKVDKLPLKVDGRSWISLFAMLRNKTRGHGALLSGKYGEICPLLEQSIKIFSTEFILFKRPWCFLHRNLSGKYRISKFTEEGTAFDSLKQATSSKINLLNGVYVYFDHPVKVALMQSNVDATDFFFPNGGFNDKQYELISYHSGNRMGLDAAPYLAPTTPLPSSETQGIGDLDTQGNCFGNLPPLQGGYIQRTELEESLSTALKNDRHPIITLAGRGGIGKTWLTLKVLHEISQQDRFSVIIWFSARDIDLMPEGPKLVSPHVLSIKDIANEYVHLVQPEEMTEKKFKATEHFARVLSKNEIGPILFVFDNFETVRSPAELFSWIDTYIRLPNKVLITTRARDFKADYPIDVLGMNESESDELIISTAKQLGVMHLLTDQYKRELYQESNGHPYVMKILLGEVAKSQRIGKVGRIVATMDTILDALFERTYGNLSPAASRVFLTLCAWRVSVPSLALEAVLLRPSNERMDVSCAIEELRYSSFIETSISQQDGELFITVPLAAAVFGKRKHTTSPMKSAIELDLQLLHEFGSGQASDIQRGVMPRIERLFSYIAKRISQGNDTVESYRSMIEFIASKQPEAWMLSAKLYEELESSSELEQSKEAIRRYLESSPVDIVKKRTAWNQLSYLCQKSLDYPGEIHARVELCELPDASFQDVSDTVNRVNTIFSEARVGLETDEKKIVARRLTEIMMARISEGNATDCSRLAWLYLRLADKENARKISLYGLTLEPDNIHCQNLIERCNGFVV